MLRLVDFQTVRAGPARHPREPLRGGPAHVRLQLGDDLRRRDVRRHQAQPQLQQHVAWRHAGGMVGPVAEGESRVRRRGHGQRNVLQSVAQGHAGDGVVMKVAQGSADLRAQGIQHASGGMRRRGNHQCRRRQDDAVFKANVEARAKLPQ